MNDFRLLIICLALSGLLVDDFYYQNFTEGMVRMILDDETEMERKRIPLRNSQILDPKKESVE